MPTAAITQSSAVSKGEHHRPPPGARHRRTRRRRPPPPSPPPPRAAPRTNRRGRWRLGGDESCPRSGGGAPTPPAGQRWPRRPIISPLKARSPGGTAARRRPTCRLVAASASAARLLALPIAEGGTAASTRARGRGGTTAARRSCGSPPLLLAEPVHHRVATSNLASTSARCPPRRSPHAAAPCRRRCSPWRGRRPQVARVAAPPAAAAARAVGRRRVGRRERGGREPARAPGLEPLTSTGNDVGAARRCCCCRAAPRVPRAAGAERQPGIAIGSERRRPSSARLESAEPTSSCGRAPPAARICEPPAPRVGHRLGGDSSSPGSNTRARQVVVVVVRVHARGLRGPRRPCCRASPGGRAAAPRAPRPARPGRRRRRRRAARGRSRRAPRRQEVACRREERLGVSKCAAQREGVTARRRQESTPAPPRGRSGR